MHEKKPGSPFPLGITVSAHGVNFSLFASSAKEIALAIYKNGHENPITIFNLDPKINKTGNIWHIFISGLEMGLEYAYFEDQKGPFLDPYAKKLNTSFEWQSSTPYHPKGIIEADKPFDWEHSLPPDIPFNDLIIYEMHVRSFTKHPSSKVKHPGTFLGIIEKIPHLKKLGINAVELMPVYEFNESEYHRKHPHTHKPLCNYWGYSTVNYFSLMNRFAVQDSLVEFKQMVREFHKHGIEVILDVVYNHTAEGGKHGPALSFKGIDRHAYYLMDHTEFLDYTGCGNTVRANFSVTSDLILDSLRYFVTECHVDGFRFDLASAMTRGARGHPLGEPPLFKRMVEDPILSKKKLIAEAWDTGGLYQVGHFPSHAGIIGEWNGFYRDSVRRFIKGSDGCIQAFTQALCGSQNLYGNGRKPHHSINFITAHDGFTLRDLVSYQDKHNFDNGENNHDGNNDNESWNCGTEGETHDKKVLDLRKKQIKNFMTALFLSLGTPMILMGDEYGHSRKGNNNAWCQDNELNYFLWDELEKNEELFAFAQKVIAIRKEIPQLKKDSFFTKDDISWHGINVNHPDWGAFSKFIAFTIHNEHHKPHYYIAFNAHYDALKIELPQLNKPHSWHRVIDTALPLEPHPQIIHEIAYTLPSYTALVLKAL